MEDYSDVDWDYEQAMDYLKDQADNPIRAMDIISAKIDRLEAEVKRLKKELREDALQGPDAPDHPYRYEGER